MEGANVDEGGGSRRYEASCKRIVGHHTRLYMAEAWERFEVPKVFLEYFGWHRKCPGNWNDLVGNPKHVDPTSILNERDLFAALFDDKTSPRGIIHRRV